MSAISNYLEDKWLRMLSGGTAYTAPATYVALFTVAPADDGTGGTEVSGGSYARVQVNQDGTTEPYWNTPVQSGGAGLIDNQGAITFPTASGDWGEVVAVGIYDASTVGNLLYHGALAANRTVLTGDTFEFADGNFDVTLA